MCQAEADLLEIQVAEGTSDLLRVERVPEGVVPEEVTLLTLKERGQVPLCRFLGFDGLQGK